MKPGKPRGAWDGGRFPPGPRRACPAQPRSPPATRARGRLAAPTGGRARGETERLRSRDRASRAAPRGRACPSGQDENADPTFASSESCSSEERRRIVELPFRVERATAREVARLGIVTEAERERQRRASRPRLRLRRARRRRASVRGQDRGRDDRDRGGGRQRDEKDDTPSRAHRATIAARSAARLRDRLTL